MLAATWNLMALIAGGTGALIALIGTLMIANGYYPSTTFDFLIALPGMVWHAITLQRKRLDIAQKFSREDKTLTLMGVLVVFIGFVFQMMAAVFAFIGTLPDVPTHK